MHGVQQDWPSSNTTGKIIKYHTNQTNYYRTILNFRYVIAQNYTLKAFSKNSSQYLTLTCHFHFVSNIIDYILVFPVLVPAGIHSNSSSICHTTAKYLSIVLNILSSHVFDTPDKDDPRIIEHRLFLRKIERWGYQEVKECKDIQVILMQH